MQLVPDWAPNVHPIIVHFPIAILFLAAAFDLFALILRKLNWLRIGAGVLYIIGGAAAIVTYFTGQDAVDSVKIPALAESAVGDHADWALRTVWFFGVYGIVRLIFLWRRLTQQRPVHLVIFVIGLVGLFLLFETGEHGAQLVFRYGIGVKAAEQTAKPETKTSETDTMSAKAGIIRLESHAWEWEPGRAADQILKSEFNWLEGSFNDLNVTVEQDSVYGEVAAFHLQNSKTMFVVDESIKNVQASLRLNLDNFQGSVMIMHHLQDRTTYDFVGIEDGQMQLGRVEKGELKVEDQDAVRLNGWFAMRAVGDGRHFRGYVNDELITHGHVEELPTGKVGLLIKGSGSILLDRIAAQPLEAG